MARLLRLLWQWNDAAVPGPIGERKADNSYAAVLQYDALAKLPLSVTVMDAEEDDDKVYAPITAETVGVPDTTAPVVTITSISSTAVVFTATDDTATLTATDITVAGSSTPAVDASYTIGAVTADATVAESVFSCDYTCCCYYC